MNEIIKYFKNSFFALVLLIFVSCDKKPEKERYLIPENYLGRVIIFYDQAGGKSIKYENGFRVYQVSKDGFLSTKFKTNFGFFSIKGGDLEFAYVDTNNKIKKLLPIRYIENDPTTPSDTIVQVFKMGNGMNGKLKYSEFYIDKYSNASKYFSNNSNSDLKEWETLKKKAGVISE